MKAIIGRPDYEPGGFDFTDHMELLSFGGGVCGRGIRGTCGCERAFMGIYTTKGATLGEVVELPDCFELRDEFAKNKGLQRCLDIAAELEPGTLLRARYNFEQKDWTWEVVGPN